jgi:hypothetical protein
MVHLVLVEPLVLLELVDQQVRVHLLVLLQAQAQVVLQVHQVHLELQHLLEQLLHQEKLQYIQEQVEQQKHYLLLNK